jgi:hypothetical protein
VAHCLRFVANVGGWSNCFGTMGRACACSASGRRRDTSAGRDRDRAGVAEPGATVDAAAVGGSRQILWLRFATTEQAARVFAAPTVLPDDPAALQLLLHAALAEIERLRLRIAGLERNRFGQRSERLEDAAFQPGAENLEQSLAEPVAKLDAASKAETTERRAQPSCGGAVNKRRV